MSLYNMMHGYNEHSVLVLSVLGLTCHKVPRFRDAYIKDNSLVVFTRTGGGNRDYYENEATHRKNHSGEGRYAFEPFEFYNDDLRKNPNYISDHDDEYDSTFAHFIFKFPDEFKEKLTAIARQNSCTTPTQKMRNFIEGLPNGTTDSGEESKTL